MIAKEFTMQKKGEHISAIEKLIADIRNNRVNLENYKEIYNTAMSKDQVLLSNIENEITNYSTILDDYKEMFEKDYVKTALNNNMVPIDLYEMLENLFKYTQRVAELKFIQVELFKTLCENMFKTMETVSAVDIQKDALREFRSMQKEMLEFSKQLANTKLQIMEDKYTSLLSIAQDKNEQLVKSLNNDFLLLINQLVQKNKLNATEVEPVLLNHKDNVDKMKSKIVSGGQNINDIKYQTEEDDLELNDQKITSEKYTPEDPSDSPIPSIRKTSNKEAIDSVREVKKFAMNEKIKQDFNKKTTTIPNYDNIEDTPAYPTRNSFDGEKRNIDFDN